MTMKQTRGSIFQQLITAWIKSVGVDIIGQAEKYRERESNVLRT
jgi:hypothetical protein